MSASPGLDTSANNDDTRSQTHIASDVHEVLRTRHHRRVERARLQAADRALTARARIRECGRGTWRSEGVGFAADLHQEPGSRHAGFRGVIRCNSPSACAWCSPRIGRERARRLGLVMQNYSASGGQCIFATFTLGHMARWSLTQQQVTDEFFRQWRQLTQRRPWRGLARDGFFRGMEMTVSKENGPHPHFHVIFFVRDVASALVQVDAILNDWVKGVNRSTTGYRASRAAQDVRVCTSESVDLERLGGYVLKESEHWTIADEATQWTAKFGHGDSVTPIQALATFAETGDVTAGGIWQQWEAATAHHRIAEFSPGFEAQWIGDEITDEDIVLEAGELDESQDSVDVEEFAGLSRQDFYKLVLGSNGGDPLSVELLWTIETAPLSELRSRLDSWACSYGVHLIWGSTWTRAQELDSLLMDLRTARDAEAAQVMIGDDRALSYADRYVQAKEKVDAFLAL